MNVPSLLQRLLWPLSLLYGAGVRVRVWLYANRWFKQKRLNAPVISVGNLSVGGTGKTPMVIWLAEKFLADGKRVAILSRGYRGANGTSDEIELMKFRLQGRVSFGVGKNRFAEGCRLESRHSIDVFLLDDGFQHLQLARPEYSFDGCVSTSRGGVVAARWPPSGTRCGHEPRKFDYFYSSRNGVWNARGDREARSVSGFRCLDSIAWVPPFRRRERSSLCQRNRRGSFFCILRSRQS